jgi:hypothetical protein
VRRFVPYFVDIMKPLQRMIKKYIQFKWTLMGNEAFKNIKASIDATPYPWNPYFNKYLLLYKFMYDHSLATMIMYKDEKQDEYIVAFMSSRLQGTELNYPLVDKQELVFHKDIK